LLRGHRDLNTVALVGINGSPQSREVYSRSMG
jgi:hypothetical protein